MTKIWRKFVRDVTNEGSDVSGLLTTAVFDTKIREVENKTPNVSGIVKKTVLDAKISKIKDIPLLLILINLREVYLMQR